MVWAIIINYSSPPPFWSLPSLPAWSFWHPCLIVFRALSILLIGRRKDLLSDVADVLQGISVVKRSDADRLDWICPIFIWRKSALENLNIHSCPPSAMYSHHLYAYLSAAYNRPSFTILRRKVLQTILIFSISFAVNPHVWTLYRSQGSHASHEKIHSNI